MSAAIDRDQLVAIFERHRQAPGTPFDPGNFRDYLLRDPHARGAVHNSFVGLRRLNAFVNEVQLSYGVCFSLHDLESNQSLDRFIVRIEQLRRSPRGSLASLRNQKRAGFGWNVVAIANVILLAVVLPLRHSPTWILVPAVVFFGLNSAVFGMWWQRAKYVARLQLLLHAACERCVETPEVAPAASIQRQSP